MTETHQPIRHFDAVTLQGRQAAHVCLTGLFLLLTPIAVHADSPGDSAALLRTAAGFHRQGDYSHSVPLLKQVLQASPRNFDANLMLGQDLYNSGHTREAAAPFDTASKIRPDDPLGPAWLAKVTVRLGDYFNATLAHQSAVVRSKEASEYLVEWADFCLDRSHDLGSSLRNTKRGEATALRISAASRPEGNEQRISSLEQSAAADPDQRGIWAELGSAQLALGRETEARESLKKAEEREPHESETLRLEAMLAALDQRWPDAEERLKAIGALSTAELRRALSLWPSFLLPGPEASGLLWDCLRTKISKCALPSALTNPTATAKQLYAEGRWEQLARLPSPAATAEPESLWHGVALARIGDCPHAISLLEAGLPASPLTASYWLEVCYAIEGDRIVSQLRSRGDAFTLHELRGDLLLRLRNDGAAAQIEYGEALKTQPRSPHLLAGMADAYMRTGDNEKAKDAAHAALAVDPHQSLALHTLVLMAMKEREYEGALPLLKKLLAMNPDDDWARVQQGVANAQLGHPELAVAALAAELAAGFPDPKGALHAQLGNALRKLGRSEEAKQAMAEAGKLADAALENHEKESPDAAQ